MRVVLLYYYVIRFEADTIYFLEQKNVKRHFIVYLIQTAWRVIGEYYRA